MRKSVGSVSVLTAIGFLAGCSSPSESSEPIDVCPPLSAWMDATWSDQMLNQASDLMDIGDEYDSQQYSEPDPATLAELNAAGENLVDLATEAIDSLDSVPLDELPEDVAQAVIDLTDYFPGNFLLLGQGAAGAANNDDWTDAMIAVVASMLDQESQGFDPDASFGLVLDYRDANC